MSRLAVNMMVRDGAAVLRRCLLPLRGAADELVVVDTGSTDGTRAVLEEVAAEMGVARYRYHVLPPTDENFIRDEAASWRAQLPGPFTGALVPKDWAAVRNLALDDTEADYVLKLDADDEPLCPAENWLRACDMLDARDGVDAVSCPYEICDGAGRATWLSMYQRLWRRPSRTGSQLRWAMPCHERLWRGEDFGVVYAAGGLRVRDHRDAPRTVAHRDLKVLLWDRESGERRTVDADSPEARLDAEQSFTLGHEAAEVLPELARELLLGVVAARGCDQQVLSDCYYHLGRCMESQGRGVLVPDSGRLVVDDAATYYFRADATHPHPQALLRLHALYLREGMLAAARNLRPAILERTRRGLYAYNYDLVLAAEVFAMEKMSDV